MNTSTYAPKEFLKHFCLASGIKHFDPTDRACVIVRSPADYGADGTVIIEFEGSPPRFPIYFGCGLFIDGKKANWDRARDQAIPILLRFLEAHPANDDGSPVWIGKRWRDRK
jgi:hypothetical protein